MNATVSVVEATILVVSLLVAAGFLWLVVNGSRVLVSMEERLLRLENRVSGTDPAAPTPTPLQARGEPAAR